MRQGSSVRDDLGLAQEAHTLISLFLDIADAETRRRCVEFVRREAHGREEASPPSGRARGA